MEGWDFDKIVNNVYGATLFTKDNRIYVGVLNRKVGMKFDDIRPAKPGEEFFHMVVYKQF
jgi:hypothetical protein